MIYFMRSQDGNISTNIKIGHTDNLARRHAQLEKHYGIKLEILTTMQGDREREREIHNRFRHSRLGRTEQFWPDPELLEYIGQPVSNYPVDVSPMNPQSITVSIKGSQEWRDWLEAGARHCRFNLPTLVDHAVAEYLKSKGFDAAPPER